MLGNEVSRSTLQVRCMSWWLPPATPHTFRHQAITWLTRHAGLSDAESQLITDHERRETLAVCQHVALDKQLEERYQTAMSDIDL